jgi:hypothetical protein
LQFCDVVLVFQDRAQRVGDDLGREGEHIQRQQAFRPVDGFGDAGFLEQVLGAQALDEGHHLAREGLGGFGGAGAQDLDFAVEGRGNRPSDTGSGA